jgi:nucleoside 2-deoxyribosyltransferase
MNIYFAGSIRGGREDAKLYLQLIDYLKGFATVLTEHVGDPALTSAGLDGPTDKFIHDRDVAWLKQTDALVAEVTTVSMGVGYEIGRMVEMSKPVLCLFREKSGRNISAMITGCDDLTLVRYGTIHEGKEAIRRFIKQLKR